MGTWRTFYVVEPPITHERVNFDVRYLRATLKEYFGKLKIEFFSESNPFQRCSKGKQ
jgi:hypothetical protein